MSHKRISEWAQLSAVPAVILCFGLQMSIRISHLNNMAGGYMAVRYKPHLVLSGKWPSRTSRSLGLLFHSVANLCYHEKISFRKSPAS